MTGDDHDGSEPTLGRVADRLGVPSRHDVVLAGMPVTFALAAGVVAPFVAVDGVAVAVGALVSAVLVVEGVFRHPPPSESR